MLRLKSTEGNVATELAIVFPLAIFLVGATVEWCLVFFSGHVLDDAARHGARLAVATPNLTNPDTIASQIQSRIPKLGYLDGVEVEVEGPQDLADDYSPHLMVTVTVIGKYKFLLLGMLGLDTISIVRRNTKRYEWQVFGTLEVVDPDTGQYDDGKYLTGGEDVFLEL